MKKLIYFFLCFRALVFSTELEPWFGVDKLIEVRPSFTFRAFSHVDVNGHSIKKNSNASFTHLSTSFSPTPSFSFELEGLVSYSKVRTFSVESGSLTARYLLFDDVAAEYPLSVAVGATLTEATRRCLHDFNCFYHGTTETEFHLSMGKEFPCKSFWGMRVWGMVGYGIAYRFSPWLHSHFEIEKNFCDQFQLGLFADGLYGLGHNRFPLFDPFIGYGPIKHRDVELGVFLGYKAFKLMYANRVFARNYPRQAHTFLVSVYIPFNLTYLPFKVSY